MGRAPVSTSAMKLLESAWNKPELLKKIIRDDHPSWDAVLHEVKLIKEGLSAFLRPFRLTNMKENSIEPLFLQPPSVCGAGTSAGRRNFN